ncbi:PLAC8 family-domain-containing protein [Mycena belliarum]|uniref:PLAC8 family-domain-containing protein n=1 Tax=Mycena belliarum TaxID=1033014 RepID=A0AAD6XSG5_9AGAR|nr:PLAC8 family-domain-containing protein [Mycena belliae]
MPTVGMQIGGNRNAANKPLDSNGKREWSNGLCGCFSACGTCCYAFWCPCIVHGKNKQRLRHLAEQNSPDPEGGSCCSGSCWAHCLLTGCVGAGFILQCLNRGEVRSRYGIEGGSCGDFCSSCCCAPCDLTQVSREIELEEKSFGQRY